MVSPEDLVRSVCLSFPAVEERPSHGHPAWFVRGKRQFATYHAAHHDVSRPHLWCAAPPGAQEALVARDPGTYFRPPYVGHRGWLGMYLDTGAEAAEIEGLLVEAFRSVAPPTLLARFDRAGETDLRGRLAGS